MSTFKVTASATVRSGVINTDSSSISAYVHVQRPPRSIKLFVCGEPWAEMSETGRNWHYISQKALITRVAMNRLRDCWLKCKQRKWWLRSTEHKVKELKLKSLRRSSACWVGKTKLLKLHETEVGHLEQIRPTKRLLYITSTELRKCGTTSGVIVSYVNRGPWHHIPESPVMQQCSHVWVPAQMKEGKHYLETCFTYLS